MIRAIARYAGSMLTHRPTFKQFAVRNIAVASILVFAAAARAATPEGSSITLRWSDNSDNELGFVIERSKQQEGFSTLGIVVANQTQFSDADLIPGSTYAYRVRAYNAYGYSEFTNQVVVTIAENGQNGPPSLSMIDNAEMLRGEGPAYVPFTVTDQHVSLNALSFSFTSSNETLLPVSKISVSGSNSKRKLVLSPETNLTGSSVVSVTASNGFQSATASFTFTVKPNRAPTMSSIGARSTQEATPLGPLAFTVSDPDSPASILKVTAVSSDQAMLPNGNIALSGSSENRSVTVNPVDGHAGQVTVTLTVSDGVNKTTGAFVLTVAANKAPVISKIDDQTIESGEKRDGISFSVGDAETSASSLVVSAASSNQNLLPQGGVKLGGSGANRTLSLTPAPGNWGVSTVSVRVSDGVRTTTQTFSVIVTPGDDAVSILSFHLEGGVAVTEVRNVPHKNLSLWKVHELGSGQWTHVKAAEAFEGDDSTVIIDPNPGQFPVFYRVMATDMDTLEIEGKKSTMFAESK